MGFQSQPGHVGFKTQVSKGTYASPGSGGTFMKVKSGALASKRTLMIPDPEIGGGRDVPDALLGPVAFVGQYDFYARLESFATLLQGALGFGDVDNVVGSGTTQVGTHTITPTDTTLPWLSVEEEIGNGYEYYEATDVKVNTLHLEANADGYLLGTAGLVGLTQVAVPSASATPTPTFDNTPLIVGTNITVTFGGVQLPAKSFKFDLNNNIEENDFRLGSLMLGDAIEKRREITLGATIRPNDNLLLRQAIYGSSPLTGPGGLVTKSPVVLTASSYEVIGTTLTVYSISFNVGLAAIKPFEVKPTGQDAIQHDLEIQMLR